MEIAAAGGHNIIKMGNYYTVALITCNYLIIKYLKNIRFV